MTTATKLGQNIFEKDNLDSVISFYFNSLLNMSDSPITEIEPETEGSEAIPQSITQSLELGGENSKEITFDEASSQLQCDDPWLQRKMAEKQM